MRVDDFDFDLPNDRVALRPAVPREDARMLVVSPECSVPYSDVTVGQLPNFLRPGDCLVVNDTRVLPARLMGTRQRGDSIARIEATLHKRFGIQAWWAFVRPSKKLAVGETVQFKRQSNGPMLLGTVLEKSDAGEVLFQFDVSDRALDQTVEAVGVMPLPPYIAAKRAEDAKDESDYQTIFAHKTGAVAAPTAGLHFTPALLNAISVAGVSIVHVTLHVGAGTFLPVKVEDTENHKMHAEWGEISVETAKILNETKARGGRVVAVGTTSLRVLETSVRNDGSFVAWSGDTSIFITPGFRFRAVDILMTNFHLPRSTLFMLVSAFSGLDTMLKAYKHAMDTGYRFYSYGDACLLHRRG
jgi:S-adenosylmethionine:tRNA ribosyltransferase-isomerase